MGEFFPVVLAGGSGERFWPLSRRAKPKQFLTLDDSGQSLLQATVERVGTLGRPEDVLVVTGHEHRSLVLEQLPDLALENLLVEPVGRDTAPAVLYAALRVTQIDPQGTMGVFPSDHRVERPEAFRMAVGRARAAAEKYGSLVTLGIAPTYAATGYGYIERGAAVEEEGGLPVHAVSRFVEKPDRETAERFLASGRYAWNGGMFVWTVQAILDAFRTHQPDLFERLSAAVARRGALRDVFPTLPKISIDYAVMEHARNVQVVPADIGWDDLGDWNALERLLRGEGQNVSVGRHVGLDTDGAILYTVGGDGLIATIGLDDVVVVRTDEVTLVVRKDRTQDIKKVVAQLKAHPELERFV